MSVTSPAVSFPALTVSVGRKAEHSGDVTAVLCFTAGADSQCGKLTPRDVTDIGIEPGVEQLEEKYNRNTSPLLYLSPTPGFSLQILRLYLSDQNSLWNESAGQQIRRAHCTCARHFGTWRRPGKKTAGPREASLWGTYVWHYGSWCFLRRALGEPKTKMAAPVGPVRFWKPGTEGPGANLAEERQSNAEVSSVIYNPHASLSIEQQRQKLPVFKLRNHILYLVENYQTVVIIGETGCGKSTQIPQYLTEAGWTAEGRVVGVTQPRRVAAISVAGRVAEERGALLGHEVGYCIRFDDCTDPQTTRIKFLTDGMLVREMMSDPLLTRYSVLMLDEAHERTLYTDIAIGLLKKIQNKRGDLRLIVASATLDAEKFKAFFNQNDTSDPNRDTCAILTVEGRTFPVDIFYTQSPVPDYLKSTVQTVMKIHQSDMEGDILAFLTGQEEVESVVSMLVEQARILSRSGMKKHLRVLPMYAGSLLQNR
ncbi:unnamed protein product [Ranitomeya imitator]|uniref:Helicase ATP-binding domain-containing protein n=1 Tax=Ranitomeya imitator TaxID=111125 RepID=A0ABN9MNX9_9NEOB|nr:unnamed protein product [Ranitomeya imitator]